MLEQLDKLGDVIAARPMPAVAARLRELAQRAMEKVAERDDEARLFESRRRMAEALNTAQSIAEAGDQWPLTLDEINEEIRAERQTRKAGESNNRPLTLGPQPTPS